MRHYSEQDIEFNGRTYTVAIEAIHRTDTGMHVTIIDVQEITVWDDRMEELDDVQLARKYTVDGIESTLEEILTDIAVSGMVTI